MTTMFHQLNYEIPQSFFEFFLKVKNVSDGYNHTYKVSYAWCDNLKSFFPLRNQELHER